MIYLSYNLNNINLIYFFSIFDLCNPLQVIYKCTITYVHSASLICFSSAALLV